MKRTCAGFGLVAAAADVAAAGGVLGSAGFTAFFLAGLQVGAATSNASSASALQDFFGMLGLFLDSFRAPPDPSRRDGGQRSEGEANPEASRARADRGPAGA